MRYKIERNVPPPMPGVWGTTYPFAKMKPGDSFYAPNRTNALGSLQYWKRKIPGSTWTSRREKDGVRIWRLT